MPNTPEGWAENASNTLEAWAEELHDTADSAPTLHLKALATRQAVDLSGSAARIREIHIP